MPVFRFFIRCGYRCGSAAMLTWLLFAVSATMISLFLLTAPCHAARPCDAQVLDTMKDIIFGVVCSLVWSWYLASANACGTIPFDGSKGTSSQWKGSCTLCEDELKKPHANAQLITLWMEQMKNGMRANNAPAKFSGQRYMNYNQLLKLNAVVRRSFLLGFRPNLEQSSSRLSASNISMTLLCFAKRARRCVMTWQHTAFAMFVVFHFVLAGPVSRQRWWWTRIFFFLCNAIALLHLLVVV